MLAVLDETVNVDETDKTPGVAPLLPRRPHLAAAAAAALLLPLLLLHGLGCNGGTSPVADSGAEAAPDAAGPAGSDAGSPAAADAGPACPTAYTRCGERCCDDQTQVCSNGRCVARSCAPLEITCGEACCSYATEYCDSANTCQPSATCNTREIVCGSSCCDARTSYCAFAPTSTCGELATTCTEGQHVCGSRCCEPTETCDAKVHACRGDEPVACYPLAPTVCTEAEACLYDGDGWSCGAAGTALEGQSCYGDTECAPGLQCVGTLFEAFCYRYCRVFDALACRGGACLDAFGDRRVGLCVCDPLTQLGCGLEEACYSNGISPSCAPPGPGPVGSSCVLDSDCAKGLTCGFTGRCTGFCDPWFPSDCGEDRGGPKCISYGDYTGFCGTACNPLEQDCPEPGDACFASPFGGGFCAPAGAVPDGERCDGPTACRKGSSCMQLSPESDFFCLPLCRTSAGSCGSGGTCVALGEGGLGGCVGAACDPVLRAGCAAGQGCYWDEPSLGYACLPAGSGPAGAACALDSDCLPGLTCAGTCVRYCRPGAPGSPCSGEGATCRDYRGTGFGACVNDLCDPRAQDCPDPADACYPAEAGYFCHEPGAVADGLTCTALTDCRKGSTCLGGSQSKQCYRLCDAAAPIDLCAATSQTCMAFSGPLGVCY